MLNGCDNPRKSRTVKCSHKTIFCCVRKVRARAAIGRDVLPACSVLEIWSPIRQTYYSAGRGDSGVGGVEAVGVTEGNVFFRVECPKE
ncbi:hypothetical protein NPIL_613581 [Nephila pilipes]|uniref:Uncharacterized protein n=1 Tax=Nephila pilipes TaxID=299642 RepID=A0A8X6QLV2_NEPPI|nr:hypothetical protein NPIL_613581 [Nephila pilipes]